MHDFTTRIFVFIALMISLRSVADAEILELPFPEASTNGAAHYNRAMLTLSGVPIEHRSALAGPIWEVFGDSTKEDLAKKVKELTLHTRHAIAAAVTGSEKVHADFGIDYGYQGHNSSLPHAQPMLQLGRLLTLSGIGKQIEEDWEGAAIQFFASMRIGRHMAEQPTLVESLVGVEILENNYYAFAFWAAKCPNKDLVTKAFTRLELGSASAVNPVRTIAYEAVVFDRQLQRLMGSYPNGSWSEMLLESLGEYEAVGKDLDDHRDQTRKKCIACGVPATAFESPAAFTSYVEKIRNLHKAYLSDVAVCMHLPVPERLQEADRLMNQYGSKFKELGDQHLLDARQIASFFATHSAQQQMARVALAAAATRDGNKFPATLKDIPLLSGSNLLSPYDGSPIEYEVLNDGSDISVRVKAADVKGIALPAIEFTSER